MSMRIAGLCCLVLALLPSIAAAQQSELTNRELTAAVIDIRRQLGAVSSNVTETAGQLSELKTKVDRLGEGINEELEQQRQILDSISRADSSGQRIPRLSAIMDKSADFRTDMRNAVNRSMETEGWFTVTNRMGGYQTISVNRASYGLNPGETKTLKVPVGTVTTQLPGQNLKTWTVTAPHYTQRLELVPSSTSTTVYRPSTTVYYAPQEPLNYSTYYSPYASSYSTYYSPYASSYSTYYSPYTSNYSTYYSPYASSYSTYYSPAYYYDYWGSYSWP